MWRLVSKHCYFLQANMKTGGKYCVYKKRVGLDKKTEPERGRSKQTIIIMARMKITNRK